MGNLSVNSVNSQFELQRTTQSENGTADVSAAPLPLVEDSDDSGKKPPKTTDFCYDNFPKGSKSEAQDHLRDAINEVRDLQRLFNNDFPTNPYVVPYDEIPNPADYSKKNAGSKEKAYENWKKDLNVWKENCKQDMVALRSSNLYGMEARLSQQMQSGFYNVYMQQGMTQQLIMDVFNQLNGDINSIKAVLDAELNDIKNGVNEATRAANRAARIAQKQGELTRKTVIKDGNLTREIVQNESIYTNRVVREEGSKTRDAVERDGDRTRKDIQNNKDEAHRKLQLKEEINIAIRNNNDKARAVIVPVLRSEGYRMDNRVMDESRSSLSNIINNIDDEALLTKIRNGLSSSGLIKD